MFCYLICGAELEVYKSKSIAKQIDNASSLVFYKLDFGGTNIDLSLHDVNISCYSARKDDHGFSWTQRHQRTACPDNRRRGRVLNNFLLLIKSELTLVQYRISMRSGICQIWM